MPSAWPQEQLGLITRVLPERELDSTVDETVRKLVEGPFVAIQCCKSNMRAAVEGGLDAALDTEAENQGKTFKSADFVEGVTAFLQKRKANFKGN